MSAKNSLLFTLGSIVDSLHRLAGELEDVIDILRGDSIDDEAEFFAWLGGQKMTLEEEDKELEAYFREQREAEMQAQSAGK